MPAMAPPQRRSKRGPSQFQGKGQYSPKGKTQQWRNWKSLNQTDSRPAIEDDDLWWLENVMSVGRGSLKVVPCAGATIATIAVGIARQYGVTIGSTPFLITINSDGSMSQVSVPGGVVTTIAPAGTVTTDAVVTEWRNTHALIVDPTTGYHSWDGATYTAISGATTGDSIAVFEGRVWIASGRTITYTAPNTFNSFVAGDGAGSVVITDEAFPGEIVALRSALEQLWIVGSGAIDALSNVQATGVSPAVVTTFAITNIVTNLGSASLASVIGYFRALGFMAPFGAYALSGVTPQKLSEKLDGFFPYLTLGSVPAGVAVIESLPVLCFLATYIGTNLQSQVATPGNTQILLCFKQGTWFLGVQNNNGALNWITTCIVSGVSQVWGCTSAGAIFRCFGGDSDDTVIWKVSSKLYDFGEATTTKALTKVGVDYQATGSVTITLTVESEFTTGVTTLSGGNTLTIVNNAQAVLQLLNNLNNPLNIVTQGQVLDRQNASIFGRYLGWTLNGTTTPLQIQLVAFEFFMSRKWDINSRMTT